MARSSNNRRSGSCTGNHRPTLLQRRIWLGLTLTGIVIGVRGTFGPIVTALISLLYVFVTVTYFYWMVPEYYDYGFDEWFSRNWWMYAFSGVLVFGLIASAYRRNSDTWNALRASYSAGPETFGDKDEYPARRGLLRIDEEAVEVHVFSGQEGLFIAKENEGHIFFPWSRLREIRISDAKPNTANIEVDRKNMTPLRMSLPWDSRFSKEVPTDVPLIGH